MPRKASFKAPKPQAPVFLVWCPDVDPECHHGIEYAALDARAAAKLYAEHYHADRGGNECEWPIVFYVQPVRLTASESVPAGDVVVVSVMREYVPEFIADDPLPLAMKPSHHVRIRGQSVLCEDPRLALGEWPKGQTVELVDMNGRAAGLEAALAKATCKACKRKGERRLSSLRSIGAIE